MAHYPTSSYNRRRGRVRRRTNIIPVFVIIVVTIVFIYGYRFLGNNKAQTSAALANTNLENQISSSMPVESTPAPKPYFEPKPSEIALEGTREPNPEVAQHQFVGGAIALVNTEPCRIIEARDRLNHALSIPMSKEQRAAIKLKLSELADIWLFSRTVFPQDRLCSHYSVKPGDLLSIIGERYKVPWEILKEVNRIHSPELLKAGETIKVIHGPFHAKIYRSTFTMDLYLQDIFIKSFPVGLGKPSRETPTGLWVVKPGGKMISPPWTDPDTHKRYEADDPDYPLGSRWIALEGIEGQAKGRLGFAIHGTTKPEEIGTTGSRGCIRLRDGDVILTYSLLMPGLSKVQVME